MIDAVTESTKRIYYLNRHHYPDDCIVHTFYTDLLRKDTIHIEYVLKLLERTGILGNVYIELRQTSMDAQYDFQQYSSTLFLNIFKKN